MSSSEINNKIILVKKASGEVEPFSVDKLKLSLQNAGAREATILHIISDIENWIISGITTKKIYGRAFSLLRREKTLSSLRYRLKQAILELGPTGYPFEVLIGELFKQKGYSVEVGVVVDGRCITHEMDVIATKGINQQLVECKYHKDQGTQVSVQVPLYVRSRVDDIIYHRETMSEYKGFKFEGWVVTNTRFSFDSTNYGECAGLNLLAWDYPVGHGLKEQLEKYNLYPITVLHNLNKEEKQKLLNMGVVTCLQLYANSNVLNDFNFAKNRFNQLMNELADVCNYQFDPVSL